MKNSRNSNFLKPRSSTRSSERTRGFTLIEVIVALALFVVLMVVVFVPLTQATRFMSVGRTRSELQQAANSTMSQLQRDLSRAIYVYPNDNLPGITDKLPYTDNPDALSSTSYFPYVRSGVGAGSRGVGNTSRIDMILPEIDAGGSVKYPITPSKYIVTYYARRGDNNAAWNAYANPVLLFRAQYPYRYKKFDTATSMVIDQAILDVTASRFTTSAPSPWIQNNNIAPNLGEPLNLELLCNVPTPSDAAPGEVLAGSHIVATPRNVALVTPQAPGSVMPNTTFTCADTNGDGKINQVTVNLTLTNFNRQVSGDGGNDSTKPVEGNLNFQKFTLMQTIDCPNVH